MEFYLPLKAGFWGLVAGSALVVGTLIGFFSNLSSRTIAAVTAFGSGVLISALAFDLMDEAYHRGGFISTGLGFLGGAAIYTIANILLTMKGAKHRKRSGNKQPSESNQPGSGLAIAMGALLDGIPESIVIGVSMIQGRSPLLPFSSPTSRKASQAPPACAAPAGRQNTFSGYRGPSC